MAVYFIGAASVNAVRIGYAAVPSRRLCDIQGASPVRVELCAVDMRGDLLTEAELHHRFRAECYHLDWFVRSPALDALIVETAARGSVPGGWYADQPLRYPFSPFSLRTPRGKPVRELMERYGFTASEYREACRLVPETGIARDTFVSVEKLPVLYDWLVSKGHELLPSDLLAPFPTEAV